MAAKKKTATAKAVKKATKVDSGFKPNYTDIIDEVEKSFKLNASSLNKKGVHRVSTGLLMSDFIMGGGIPPGIWITLYGQEQTAKSTHMMQMLRGAVEAKVPNIFYWDYEGCVTLSTVIQVRGVDVKIADLIPDAVKANPPKEPGFIENHEVVVDTLGGKTVKSKVYFGGVKPITKIDTLGGNNLSGSNHPVLVMLENGCLAWKKIEHLTSGDKIIVRNKKGLPL